MKWLQALIVVSLVGWGTGPAAGQVRMTQGGHELDANPGATSGTRNVNTAPGYNFNQGNQLITGEVGLGRSFRGAVPYTSARQFHGSLGSATLYDFHRDSVGVYQARQGPVAVGAVPIYAYSPRAVVSTADVAPSGAPVTMAVRQEAMSYASPLVRPSYADFVTVGRGDTMLQSAGAAGGQATAVQLSIADQLADRQETLAEQSAWQERLEAQMRLYRPGAAYLDPYGTRPDARGPESTARDRSGTRAPLAGEDERQPGEGLEGDSTGVGEQTSRITGRTEDARVATDRRDTQVKATPGEIEPPSPEAPFARSEQTQIPLKPGEDIYADLLRRAENIEQEQKVNQEQAPSPAPAPPQSPVLPDTAGEGGEAGEEADNLNATEAQLEQIRRNVIDLGIRYDSFASDRPNRANVAIRKAEELIRGGQYYSAIDRLDEAQRWDPNNPLVWLRGCHAHFGAGEFYSSALGLRRAMAIFPSVASIKTDLAGMLDSGNREKFDDRLAELKTLAQNDDSLYMLLCYLQYASGRTADAVGTAKYLLKSGDPKKDPQAERLASFVVDQAAQSKKPGGQ